MDDPPLLHLQLKSTPETLAVVRGVIDALAELLLIDPELLDDVKTAVSEACNNVVMHAYPEGEVGLLEVALAIGEHAITACVRDEGVGLPSTVDAGDGGHGVGLPLMKALTNDGLEFIDSPSGGTEVHMIFQAVNEEGQRLYTPPGGVAVEDGWARRLAGEAVVSVSPVEFVGPVLGRLARALAARARFSLDRFSDVYLVTDAVAAHVARAASTPRLGFSVATEPRRLQIKLGPLRPGSSSQLDPTDVRDPGSILLRLSDSVTSEDVDDGELLLVTLSDSVRR